MASVRILFFLRPRERKKVHVRGEKAHVKGEKVYVKGEKVPRKETGYLKTMENPCTTLKKIGKYAKIIKIV